MIVLGIDPGTAKMGYSVIEVSATGKNIKLIKSDVLITHQDLLMQNRLKFLYRELTAIAKQYSPSVMVIERIFFNVNAKTAIHVGQARGVALLAAADKKMEVFEYTALEAKFMLTGYGRADKKQMQQAVMELLDLDSIVKSDDANDAVAMAICYVQKGLLGGGTKE
ncbi:MAG TPA: crossover junction endodeoxyribonuclease RuvC [Candidatus Saccharimonadales bacterium]|nr:crossover junction endodeoxyribonuclease RuvC [Candidatus Saccharimonadales bacterium]